MPLREKETVSESGDIFLKKGADPFNLSFSYETFSMTSGGSAYRRRQHQYLHPAAIYAPNLQENWGSQPSRAAMDRITPPRTEYPSQKENENFGRPKRLRYLPRLSFQYPPYAQAQSNDWKWNE